MSNLFTVIAFKLKLMDYLMGKRDAKRKRKKAAIEREYVHTER